MTTQALKSNLKLLTSRLQYFNEIEAFTYAIDDLCNSFISSFCKLLVIAVSKSDCLCFPLQIIG